MGTSSTPRVALVTPVAVEDYLHSNFLFFILFIFCYLFNKNPILQSIQPMYQDEFYPDNMDYEVIF